MRYRVRKAVLLSDGVGSRSAAGRLREPVSRRRVDLVPLATRQAHVAGSGGLAGMRRLAGADDSLRAHGQAQDPGQGDGRRRDATVRRDPVEAVVERGILARSEEGPELAVDLQARPRLDLPPC